MALWRRSAALRLGCRAVTCTGRSGVETSARRPLTPLFPQQHLTPRYSAHERARCHERAPCRRLLRRQPSHRRPPPPPPPPPLAVGIAAAALAPRRSAFTSSSTPHLLQTSRARTSSHEERDLERRDLPVRIWPHLDLAAQEEGFVKELDGLRRLARRREEDGAAAARPPVRVHHDVSMDDIASRAEVVLEGLPSEVMRGDRAQSWSISQACRHSPDGPGNHGPGNHGPGNHGPGNHGPGNHGPGKQAHTCHATSQGRFPTNTWQPLPPPSPLP